MLMSRVAGFAINRPGWVNSIVCETHLAMEPFLCVNVLKLVSLRHGWGCWAVTDYCTASLPNVYFTLSLVTSETPFNNHFWR